jgi:GLPGLI family protein
MKAKFFMMILLTYNLINSQNIISGRVAYTTSISFDTINIAKKYKNNANYEIIKETTLNVLDNTSPQTYLLTFNKNHSLFIKENMLKSENENKINLIEILGGNGRFYVDNLDNIILHQIDFMGDYFLIECEKIKWNLTQESKKIGDYLCYKANGLKFIENREGVQEITIVAWYSSDLPFNFGPKGYTGLPGLILELQEGKLTFSAVKIELKSTEQIEVKKPTKGKEVTESEFKKISKEAMDSYKKGF